MNIPELKEATDFKSEMREVLNPLLNLKTEYSSEFGKTCLVCGFPIDINKRKEIIDSALSSLLALIEKRLIKEDKLMKLIPEVYADVFPLCNKVIGYTKDGTQYILQQERGEDLAKAILSEIRSQFK